MALQVQVKGLDNLRANLKVLNTFLPEQLGYAMRDEMLIVASESAEECPVDDANLHEDGSPHLVDTLQVDGPEFEGDNITVAVSYGNANDPTGDYAVIQHETLEFHHTRPGTKAKYLEDPLNARAKFIPTNLIRGVQAELNNTAYFAQGTKQLIDAKKLSNLQQQMRNKYGHLLGRFV